MTLTCAFWPRTNDVMVYPPPTLVPVCSHIELYETQSFPLKTIIWPLTSDRMNYISFLLEYFTLPTQVTLIPVFSLKVGHRLYDRGLWPFDPQNLANLHTETIITTFDPGRKSYEPLPLLWDLHMRPQWVPPTNLISRGGPLGMWGTGS